MINLRQRNLLFVSRLTSMYFCFVNMFGFEFPSFFWLLLCFYPFSHPFLWLVLQVLHIGELFFFIFPPMRSLTGDCGMNFCFFPFFLPAELDNFFLVLFEDYVLPFPCNIVVNNPALFGRDQVVIDQIVSSLAPIDGSFASNVDLW